jgi:hypothetical protein
VVQNSQRRLMRVHVCGVSGLLIFNDLGRHCVIESLDDFDLLRGRNMLV